jgi:hypothetical protein
MVRWKPSTSTTALLMEGCTGAVTITLKLRLALRLGTPLSETMTVTGLVVFAIANEGRQLNTPLEVPCCATGQLAG